MRTVLILAIAAILTACGGSGGGGITQPPPKPKALDPFLTVRIRDQLDTASVPGKVQWRLFYEVVDSVDPSGFVASFGSLNTTQLTNTCFSAAADSVGARQLSLLVVADTTAAASSNVDATARAEADRWFAGDHALPSGWMAMSFPLTDVWDSQQFRDGHGLTSADPVKWGWDLTGEGTPVLYERAAADTAGCNSF